MQELAAQQLGELSFKTTFDEMNEIRMDPVSIIGVVAAACQFATACKSICQTLSQYHSTYKNAHESLTEAFERCTELQYIVETLQQSIEKTVARSLLYIREGNLMNKHLREIRDMIPTIHLVWSATLSQVILIVSNIEFAKFFFPARSETHNSLH
jgi:hypothetical protein